MSKRLVRTLAFFCMIAALPAGCVYYFRNLELFIPDRQCVTQNSDNAGFAYMAEPINAVLKKSGVKNLASAHNIVCVMSDGFQDTDMAVLIDPTRDGMFDNYRAFAGGQVGEFKFDGKIPVDRAYIEMTLRQKLPPDLKNVPDTVSMSYYIKYLNEVGGGMSVLVSSDEAHPLLLITYSTSWN